MLGRKSGLVHIMVRAGFESAPHSNYCNCTLVDVNNLVAIAPYGNKVESSVKSLASIINEQNNYVRMLKL
jgi:hypothetical protein